MIDLKKIFLTYPDSTYLDRDEKFSKKKKLENLKKFANFFIKANFEILTTDLDTRPKIRGLTLQSLGSPGCSVTEILASDFFTG